jgi:hypothetical protein
VVTKLDAPLIGGVWVKATVQPFLPCLMINVTDCAIGNHPGDQRCGIKTYFHVAAFAELVLTAILFRVLGTDVATTLVL